MATSETVLEAVRSIAPSDVPASRLGIKAGLLIMLDDASLRRQLEYLALGRKLQWEEWLDARDLWCRKYNALQLTVPYGTCDISKEAQRGARQGNYYVLLEVLPPAEG